MSKKVFFLIVMIYFSVHALLDFLRMMFSWKVEIGQTEIATWVSGVMFIFSILMVYWTFKIKKEKIVDRIKVEKIKEDDLLNED